MASSGNSTSVSRRVTTETVNGRTVTKTVITETTVHPDGSKTVHTREEVNESHSGTGGVVSEKYVTSYYGDQSPQAFQIS